MELETEVGEAGLSERCGDELIELECECDEEDEWCVCWAAVGCTGALYVHTMRSRSQELWRR